MTNIPLRKFINGWENNEFVSHPSSMVEAGWYDWFCTDRGLYGRLKRMMPCVRRVSKSSKINLDTMYVFFKNNCSNSGTYDDFRICDLNNGEVLWTIIPCYPTVLKERLSGRSFRNKIKYVSEVWDFTLSEEESEAIYFDNLARGNPVPCKECVVMSHKRQEIYRYFGV